MKRALIIALAAVCLVGFTATSAFAQRATSELQSDRSAATEGLSREQLLRRLQAMIAESAGAEVAAAVIDVHGAEIFRAMDHNGDGTVSEDEASSTNASIGTGSAGAAGGTSLLIAGGTVTAMAYRPRQTNMGAEAGAMDRVIVDDDDAEAMYEDVFTSETNDLFESGD